jgi:hypothetical protein
MMNNLFSAEYTFEIILEEVPRTPPIFGAVTPLTNRVMLIMKSD